MLDPPDGELSMSITKAGNVFKCGAETFDVTDDQAAMLFDGGMMLMQRLRLARDSSRPNEAKK